MKLCVPKQILDQHLVVLGKTGSGKSSALRHIVEHLLDHHKRVCVIDPKGDWWGLKSSADGRSAGYPVITFGDFKNQNAQDVPINEQSGKHVAELITSGNRPCLIGFRGWMPGKMTQFWIDFALSLFNANSGELYLVIDEIHNFTPKGKVMNPEIGKSIHITNRILSEGRGIGLVCLNASQRPQKVHNDTLTSCETLVAMRVIHKSDRDAIKDWIDGCGDGSSGAEVLNSLASMSRGEAFVWSPEVGFGPTRLTFPMFTTFDSFAPPQLQKKIGNAGWADVDLDVVKEKLAAVIEEVKQKDPAELRKKLAAVQGELRALRRQNDGAKESLGRLAAQKEKRVEVRVIKDTQLDRMDREFERRDKFFTKLGADTKDVLNALREVRDEMRYARLSPVADSKPVAVRDGSKAADRSVVNRTSTPLLVQRRTHEKNGARLPDGERSILTACCQHNGALRSELIVMTGYKRSTRDAYIQRLREKSYVLVDGDWIRPTDEGLLALGADFEPLPTGSALLAYWTNRLPDGERKILEIVAADYPKATDRETLAERTGFARSTRDAYLQRMKSKRIVTTIRGEVRASDKLFS